MTLIAPNSLNIESYGPNKFQFSTSVESIFAIVRPKCISMCPYRHFLTKNIDKKQTTRDKFKRISMLILKITPNNSYLTH